MPTSHGSVAIGVDIGGTQARAAAVDSAGHVLARCHRPNPSRDTVENLIDWVIDAVTQLRDQVGPDWPPDACVGLALPGILDEQRSTVARSINLPFLEGCPLCDMLVERAGLQSVLFTDAEAATWGEYQFQQPRPSRFAHLRLGTGVACGVVIDGRLLRLDCDRTTHHELLIIDTSAAATPCNCGLSGCLETSASGAALEARANRAGLVGGVSGLAEAWRQGDQRARTIIAEAADAVALAIGNLVRRFQPDVVCLGGGVPSELPELLDLTAAAMANPSTGRPPDLQGPRLGDDAGMVGAALLASDHVAQASGP